MHQKTPDDERYLQFDIHSRFHLIPPTFPNTFINDPISLGMNLIAG